MNHVIFYKWHAKYDGMNTSYDLYADPDGWTMVTVKSNDCFMSATASRAKELEGFK